MALLALYIFSTLRQTLSKVAIVCTGYYPYVVSPVNIIASTSSFTKLDISPISENVGIRDEIIDSKIYEAIIIYS